MILHRVEWHDPHEGTRYEWHATKSAAHSRRKELGTNNSDIDHTVTTVVIPDGKLGLVDWLNEHFNTDNG
jgi:hypothetical protein